MGIDLSPFTNDGKQMEECEHTKEVASKFGIQVVCNEEEAAENQLEIHAPEGEECEQSRNVVSKFGVHVVCDEEK